MGVTWKRISKVIKEDPRTKFFGEIMSTKSGKVAVSILLTFFFMSIFAGYIAPHDPEEFIFLEDGSVARLQPPSKDNLFGTDRMGRDVLSIFLHSARTSVSVGLISALCVTSIGVTVGLIAGYYGGNIDEVLMRITDIMYSIPFLPFVLVLLLIIRPGFWNMILAMSLILWRSPCRVIRSEVLTLRTRPFILAAKISGASNFRLMYRHLFPILLPLAALYFSTAVGWAVLGEASLSFLGLGDPFLPSWGKMLFMARYAVALRKAWWWVIPPGVGISLLVISSFLISMAAEDILDPRLKKFGAA